MKRQREAREREREIQRGMQQTRNRGERQRGREKGAREMGEEKEG